MPHPYDWPSITVEVKYDPHRILIRSPDLTAEELWDRLEEHLSKRAASGEGPPVRLV